MTHLITAISTTADGSMYNRHDYTDAEIIANRRAFLQRVGITFEDTTRLTFTDQAVDFCRYKILDASWKGDGMTNDVSEHYDAYVVTEKGHALLLPVADCVGTLIFDPEHDVLMVSHLGRHSLEQNGGQKSVAFLVEHFGSRPEMLQVWTTPAPNNEVYPIWKLGNAGMKESALAQLKAAGIQDQNITDNPADTATDEHYFSFSEFLKGNRAIDGDHMIVGMMTD